MSAKRGSISLPGRLALRPSEAAETLGISERKLRELLPELPHIRRGGVVLIPVSSLEEWLAEQAQAEASNVEEAVTEILNEMEERR